MNEQLTQKQAIKFYYSDIYRDWTSEKIVRFQLFQEMLCVDFSVYHKSLEDVLGRPVFTHEIHFNHKGIVLEYLSERDKPTFDEILEIIPEHMRIIVKTSTKG